MPGLQLKSFFVNNPLGRLIMRIFLHFDTVPATIRAEHYRFYIISNIGYTVGWAIHLDWFFVFLYLGQYRMAAIQVVSIAAHVFAIILNRKGRHQEAMMIGMLEVVGHQLLAVYLLGWGAGFQYIIPAIALFPFLKHDGSLIIKSLLVLCCMSGFLYLEVFFKNAVPVYTLSHAAINFFNYSNIIFCFMFLATWGIFITIAIHRSEAILVEEKKRSDDLLLNILPAEVAEELKEKGSAAAKYFDNVTVMFTDFVNFTNVSERMTPQELIDELDTCFKAFDGIIGKYSIEKIKTIGDAYLAVAGLPKADDLHAVHTIRAAMEINEFMNARKKLMGEQTFDIRVGIHTGSVVAGIVGVKKFAYDIWGDTVNVAARMEQNSEKGRVNISGITYDIVKSRFNCEYRGKIIAKNKGELDMYFVNEEITELLLDLSFPRSASTT